MEKKSKKETVKSEEKQEKLTYEQLEEVANELSGRCTQLYKKLMEAQQVIAGFNDVGLLLEIIEKGENFSSEFVDRCTRKVEETITMMLDRAEQKKEEES